MHIITQILSSTATGLLIGYMIGYTFPIPSKYERIVRFQNGLMLAIPIGVLHHILPTPYKIPFITLMSLGICSNLIKQ